MGTQPAFNKALIGPIVFMIALYVKLIFSVNLESDFLDAVVDGVLAVGSIVGIFMHPVNPTDTVQRVFNVLIIAPIVTVVALSIKAITGFELPNDILDATVQGLLMVGGAIGLLMRPKV